MSECLAEVAILEDICSLPNQMQKIYLQLVSAIDSALQQLQPAGACANHISEDFIETLVDQMLDEDLSQELLQDRVNGEFLRQILEEAEVETAS